MSQLLEKLNLDLVEIERDVISTVIELSEKGFVLLSGQEEVQERAELYNNLPALHKPSPENKNPFDYFDAIFCINATSQTARWEQMQTRFRRLGIDKRVIRFPAIMTPSNQYVGCSLSHRTVVDIAKRRGLSNVLIFEDDALMLDTLLEELGHSLKELEPLEWKVFYLGGCYRGEASRDILGHQHLRSGAYMTCCHAIAFSRPFFDTMLNEIPGTIVATDAWCKIKHLAIDQFIYWQTEEIYSAKPTLSVQIEIMPSVELELHTRFS